MESLVEEFLTQHQQLASERVNFDSLNQEIAELVLPDHAVFTSHSRVQGEKRTQKQYDSTAMIEAARHASAIDSLATPHSTRWHGLVAVNREINDRDDVQQYFDDVTDILYTERYSTNADFAAQIFDVWRGGGVFGTSGLYVGDRLGGGLRYRAQVPAEVFVAIDAWGMVVKLHRKFRLTAKAAEAEYGDKLPAEIKRAASLEPLRKFDFLHCICENPDRKAGYADARGMKYVSHEIAMAERKLLRSGGFNSWPIPVYRYDVNPGEWYGRGWAASVLPEIKMLNRARKAQIRQTEKAVDPPLLLHDDGMLSFGNGGKGESPSLAAGSLNYDAVTADGKPKILPLHPGSDLAAGKEQIAESQRVIRDASLTSMFQILLDNPKYTATEYLGRMQEKGQLLGPMIGRTISTFLGGIVERELEILARQGKLPKMPRALMQVGGEYKLEFHSPLSRLMRMEEVTSTEQWVASMVPYAQVKPDIFDNVDFDEHVRNSARIRGVPAKILVDKDKMDEGRQARAKQAQAQKMIEAAGPASEAIKNVAMAGKASRESQVGSSVLALRQALKG